MTERPLRPTYGEAPALEQATREYARHKRSETETHTVTLTAATAKSVRHGLGRKPAGWRLIDVDAEATIWRSAWSASAIELTASADATVKVEVF